MNNSPWPIVPLGEVIDQRKEFITIDDLVTYKRCRVQLHAQGIVLRDELEGSRIKTKSQQVCHTDEFLVAEIDAKVGGFGPPPPSGIHQFRRHTKNVGGGPRVDVLTFGECFAEGVILGEMRHQPQLYL